METDLYKQLCLCVTPIVLYILSKVRGGVGGGGAKLNPPPTFSDKKQGRIIISYVKSSVMSALEINYSGLLYM